MYFETLNRPTFVCMYLIFYFRLSSVPYLSQCFFFFTGHYYVRAHRNTNSPPHGLSLFGVTITVNQQRAHARQFCCPPTGGESESAVSALSQSILKAGDWSTARG